MGPLLLKHLCGPEILPALSLLSRGATILDMHDFIVSTFAGVGSQVDEGISWIQLVRVLNYLLVTGQVLLVRNMTAESRPNGPLVFTDGQQVAATVGTEGQTAASTFAQVNLSHSFPG